MTKDQLQYQIETLVDQSCLQDVLIALAETASYKAEHIRTNWQDSQLASCWEQVAQCLDQTAYRQSVRYLTELSGSALEKHYD